MTAPRVTLPEFDGDGPADPAARSVLAHQPVLLRAFQQLYGTLWSTGLAGAPSLARGFP